MFCLKDITDTQKVLAKVLLISHQMSGNTEFFTFFSTIPGQKHRAFELPSTGCPDNLSSKGAKLHLTKTGTELHKLQKIGLIRGSIS